MKNAVLVVEDNPDNLELVRFILDRAGMQVYTAHDGRTGLELARQHLPDLVLVDLVIPELDGWELASQLKADPATSHIKVVALTAHILPVDRKRAFSAGCDGYISKPLDLSTFFDEVRKYLPEEK